MKQKNKIYLKILLGALSIIAIFLQSALLWANTELANKKNHISFENAVMDFKNFDYEGNVVYPYGEYEFYYNQWLITDKVENPIQDGLINMPFSWVGKKIEREGKKIALTSDGYATYRIHLKNIKPNNHFSIAKQDYGDSVKIYFDDILVYHYGILSKEKEENDISGKTFIESSYNVPSTGEMTMTIEVGNNGQGGLQEAPIIYPSSTSSRNSSISEALIFFSLGTLLMVLLTSFIFFLTGFKNRDYHYLLGLSELLFLSTLFSEDGLIFFNRFFLFPNYFLFETLHYIFTALFIFVLVFTNAKGTNKLNSKTRIVNLLLLITSFASWFFLLQTKYLYISYLILLLPIFFFQKNFFPKEGKISWISVTSLLTLSFTVGDIIFEISKEIEPFHYSSKAVIAIISSIRAILFLIFFIMKYIALVKSKQEYDKLYEEKLKIKNNTLKEEIKPHYLFNTLSVIRYLYHKDVKEGDEVMALFSKNFRDSIENMKKEMIPFEKEIETINQYIELENKRFDHPFEVIFDLDFVDFQIPPLTLEPIVENSVNYSKVNEKEDGFISISSSLKNDIVTIVIEDNGIGFNPEQRKENSIGQKNLIERLQMHLNAVVQVTSAIDQGTKTTITFPLKEEEE